MAKELTMYNFLQNDLSVAEEFLISQEKELGRYNYISGILSDFEFNSYAYKGSFLEKIETLDISDEDWTLLRPNVECVVLMSEQEQIINYGTTYSEINFVELIREIVDKRTKIIEERIACLKNYVKRLRNKIKIIAFSFWFRKIKKLFQRNNKNIGGTDEDDITVEHSTVNINHSLYLYFYDKIRKGIITRQVRYSY
jgi:hypothetical protein